jgi:hypothetical protein
MCHKYFIKAINICLRLVGLLLLSACQSTPLIQDYTAEHQHSGFLRDYTELEQSTGFDG